MTTILTIDDDKAVLDSVAAHLDDCGYRTLTAKNGTEGLAVLARESADLVLIDLRMPDVDGLEVLARLKETSPEIPTIVVSGTGMIQDAVDALHHGAWDYVLKPIEDFQVLNHAIDGCLEKARLLRENRAYQESLERMVAERTRDLEKANANLSQINDRLRRIVETTRSLAFCTEVDQFGAQLLEEFGQHMLATGGSIYVTHKDGLHMIHVLDPGHAADFISFPLEKGSVFELVFARKKPVLIPDVSRHPDLAASGWEGYLDGSALVFPLLDASGEVTGVLTLHSKVPAPFVDQDREIGMILASYSCEALRAVRATEHLRRSEEQFRGILDSIQIGILLVDAATNRILYANPTAATMAGAVSRAIIGLDRDELLAGDERTDLPVMDPTRPAALFESHLTPLTGQAIPILRSVSKTVLQGREALLDSFTDLSEQKRAEAEKAHLERQLRQAQKMEALGTLAGGIAHDFNNILSAVLGYAELGIVQLADPDHPLHTKLNAIYHAGQRARDLVSQILAFSRMQEKIRAPLTVGPIIKESIQLLRSSLPANIEIKSHIRTNRPVLADATEVHQVVMNLCTNAYHAMQGHGGELRIDLEAVTVNPDDAPSDVELRSGDYVQLTVSDTGNGISPAVIDRIFEPYFTTKSKTQGTGLGLAVVHGIVKNHQGSISVRSHVGRGTRFAVYLPIAVEAESARKEARLPLPRGSERVLLVDDEIALVEVWQQMLETLGYRITAAVGGAEALETFRGAPRDFDLVMTDLSMPGLSGVELARALSTIRPDLPVILCTGFSEWFEKGGGKSMGIRQVLMKPLTMEALARAVRDALDP
ncbi:MAG: response regulator [Syntrophobacteraceae bacterium]